MTKKETIDYFISWARKMPYTEEDYSKKKAAIKIAVDCLIEANSSAPCCFDMNDKCKILKERECSGCSFRRTYKEYMEDQERHNKRLIQKGYIVSEVMRNDVKIKTVHKKQAKF